jgi:hypothetical protein
LTEVITVFSNRRPRVWPLVVAMSLSPLAAADEKSAPSARDEAPQLTEHGDKNKKAKDEKDEKSPKAGTARVSRFARGRTASTSRAMFRPTSATSTGRSRAMNSPRSVPRGRRSGDHVSDFRVNWARCRSRSPTIPARRRRALT